MMPVQSPSVFHASTDIYHSKITASMFASNFLVKNSALRHNRGEDKLTKFAQSQTIESGETMENCFCSVCGTLMYRRSTGFPGTSVLRIGTVDDYNLHETILKPDIEQFGKDRVSWCSGGKGVQQEAGNYYDPRSDRFKKT